MSNRRKSRSVGLSFKDSQSGVLVSEVQPGLLADVAGFRKGDRVKRVAAVEIQRAQDILKVLEGAQTGQPFNFEVVRTMERNVGVTVAEHRPEGHGASKVYVGMAFTTSDGGLIVSSVEPEGPAERAGLRPTDKILSVEGMKMRTVLDFQGVLSKWRPGQVANFRVYGPCNLSLTIKPPSSRRASAPAVTQHQHLGNQQSSCFQCCSALPVSPPAPTYPTPAGAAAPAAAESKMNPVANGVSNSSNSSSSNSNNPIAGSRSSSRPASRSASPQPPSSSGSVESLTTKLDEAVARRIQAEEIARNQAAELQAARKECDLMHAKGLDTLTQEELINLDTLLKATQSKVMQQLLVVVQRNATKEVAEEKTQCMMCLTNKKTICFVPCGHICSCEACAQRLQACPLCRVGIQKRIVAFT